MQSSENKTKRTRKSASASTAGESAAKPAGAKHKSVAKKTAAPVVEPESKPLVRAAAASSSTTLAVSSHANDESGRLDPNRVATLAYHYWESRGGQGGSPEEDWLRAEAELRSRA